MVSRGPEDLWTSWAGPPSLTGLQHPAPCHHPAGSAHGRLTIGRTEAEVFGLCYLSAHARD